MITEISINKIDLPDLNSEDLLWVDVVQPHDAELNALADRFGLHKAALLDCLEPEHLPKIDFFGDTTFLILRAYDTNSSDKGNTPQQITRKIAIFVLKNTVVTVHRLEIDLINNLRSKWSASQEKQYVIFRLLTDIIRGVVDSYEPFIEKLNRGLGTIEMGIFQGHDEGGLLNEGYHLRRKAHISRHMLSLTLDILGSLSDVIPEISAPYFGRINHKCSRLYYYSDDILNNVDNLLSLHLAMLAKQSNESSYKINEVMRFLTVFSAFFLPLNFIASIYGMNFEHMPELKNPHGYYLTIFLMFVVGLTVLWFFKRKGYLSSTNKDSL